MFLHGLSSFLMWIFQEKILGIFAVNYPSRGGVALEDCSGGILRIKRVRSFSRGGRTTTYVSGVRFGGIYVLRFGSVLVLHQISN